MVHGRECAFGVGRTSQVSYHALERATHSWSIVLDPAFACFLCLHDFEQCSKPRTFAWSSRWCQESCFLAVSFRVVPTGFFLSMCALHKLEFDAIVLDMWYPG